MWQSLPHSRTLHAADPWCRDLRLGGSWERSQPELCVFEIRSKLQGTIWEAKLCTSFSISRMVSTFTFTISVFALNLWHEGICPPQIFLKLWGGCGGGGGVGVSPNTRVLWWVFWGWWDHAVFGVPAQVPAQVGCWSQRKARHFHPEPEALFLPCCCCSQMQILQLVAWSLTPFVR